MLTPDTSHDAALTRCAQEQTAAASDAQAGDFGARLGVQDWVKEEAMIRGGEDA